MNIIKNRVYKHFKGDQYLVIDTAINANDDKLYVIYRALYGDGQLYIRPYDEFVSKVDKDKYPNTQQEYRFEIIDINSINGAYKK